MRLRLLLFTQLSLARKQSLVWNRQSRSF